MKKSFKLIVLLTIGLLVSWGEFANATPWLTTTWGQRNEYARFAPYNPAGYHERLGCWSTAIAQIMYFHRVLPSGYVSYQGTYYPIQANLNAYTFNWNLFVNKITSSTPEASINQVAQYGYFTAVVIQKDFGTGSYMFGCSTRASELQEHYGVQAQCYSNSYYSLTQIKNIIANEINQNRPVMLHIRNLNLTEFHAVVVDAYQIMSNQFWIHINMGAEGSNDGWYDFGSPILNWDDTSYRLIMTITPPILPNSYILWTK